MPNDGSVDVLPMSPCTAGSLGLDHHFLSTVPLKVVENRSNSSLKEIHVTQVEEKAVVVEVNEKEDEKKEEEEGAHTEHVEHERTEHKHEHKHERTEHEHGHKQERTEHEQEHQHECTEHENEHEHDHKRELERAEHEHERAEHEHGHAEHEHGHAEHEHEHEHERAEHEHEREHERAEHEHEHAEHEHEHQHEVEHKKVNEEEHEEEHGEETTHAEIEAVKEEAVKEEAVKKEAVKKEVVKEEVVKEEAVKEEVVKEEVVKEEAVKEEAVKEEAVKEEAVKEVTHYVHDIVASWTKKTQELNVATVTRPVAASSTSIEKMPSGISECPVKSDMPTFTATRGLTAASLELKKKQAARNALAATRAMAVEIPEPDSISDRIKMFGGSNPGRVGTPVMRKLGVRDMVRKFKAVEELSQEEIAHVAKGHETGGVCSVYSLSTASRPVKALRSASRRKMSHELSEHEIRGIVKATVSGGFSRESEEDRVGVSQESVQSVRNAKSLFENLAVQ